MTLCLPSPPKLGEGKVTASELGLAVELVHPALPDRSEMNQTVGSGWSPLDAFHLHLCMDSNAILEVASGNFQGIQMLLELLKCGMVSEHEVARLERLTFDTLIDRH